MSFPQSFHEMNNNDYIASSQQFQQQQQRVKVVAGYALQKRLGSGSFATVHKGIRISPSNMSEHQRQRKHSTRNDGGGCDDENDTTGPASASVSAASSERTATAVVTGTNRQVKQQTLQQRGGEKKQPPNVVAIKAIARASEKLTKKVLQNLEIEISILRTYRHPNIVCMHDVIKTDGHFYLLLEYCGGGDVQRLIRSRKSGRLSERLTRRLMRDLSSGLRFLWGQELIHRDIKPQNLLLTGPLPVGEWSENPPAFNDDGNSSSNGSSDPTIPSPSVLQASDGSCTSFSLKIADFGFARHLQTASLAETLCGSPLYMAPEILQHHRYDAKADLWSVGTVLFEMIAGRPPFNGENHIDLLRNIQRKSVRLPPDVRVSKACVNLLRLLLNRNPLSRAGFKEFFDACDSFVALGCGGTATRINEGSNGGMHNGNNNSINRTITTKDNLGTIHENDHHSGRATTNLSSSNSLMTVTTTAEQTSVFQLTTQPLNTATALTQKQMTHSNSQNQRNIHHSSLDDIVSPNLAPSPAPNAAALIPNSINLCSNNNLPTICNHRLEPLTSSPPTTLGPIHQLSSISNNNSIRIPPQPTQQNWQFHQGQYRNNNEQQQSAIGYCGSTVGLVNTSSSSVSQSQTSANDDSGFVMVEHTTLGGVSSSQNGLTTSPNDASQQFCITPSTPQQLQQQPRQSPTLPVGVVNRNTEQRSAQVLKGILSTSPGTGKMLLNMVGRATLGYGSGSKKINNNDNSATTTLSPMHSLPAANGRLEEQRIAKLAHEITAVTKMIAIAEDVGRRAVSVAHLGDSRAYLGMRLMFRTNEAGSSSLISTTPMEGVVEEPGTNADDTMRDCSTYNSTSTEIMASTNHRRSLTASEKRIVLEVLRDEEEEMPFAICPDAPTVSLPSRSNPSVYNHSTSIPNIRRSSLSMKASPQMIRSRFSEALSCYLKSLKMLKGAVGAAQRVTKDLKEIDISSIGSNLKDSDVQNIKYRCEVTSNWLCSQFRGVLERADAAQVEISKLVTPAISNTERDRGQDQTAGTTVMSVEELIYNHALASGRDGAVKQLLGQYEASRSCYRSAGLLAETLLMEVDIGLEDKQLLESYVDGFAARIMELDQLMFSTSNGSNTITPSSSSRRAVSGIVGLIGPTPTPAGPQDAFIAGSPR